MRTKGLLLLEKTKNKVGNLLGEKEDGDTKVVIEVVLLVIGLGLAVTFRTTIVGIVNTIAETIQTRIAGF